ncbi:DUF91 domain-containing protein [Siminovitchia acidinfaciens]|uniref:DUF91 domain-containing protein n=1 Tax=Siminovitchia acidinfaciens TaxID=2321395 RepID=A0A429Y437_9BACI|nr:endonuclease NucS domain-containing protein [Siminovitchia acidinfaciens]RST76182.1 DUF91 domain-containing protein [Siminovitchia acidinfaciens]
MNDNKIEILKKIYGALKIDYRYNEGKRYFVYGFKNEQEEWNYNEGELLFVTENQKEVDDLKNHLFSIETGELYCTSCFKEKKIGQLKAKDTKYWGYCVWDGLPFKTLKELQNKLISSVEEFNWSNVRGLTDREDPLVFFGICSTYCMTNEEEYDHSEAFCEYEKIIQNYEQKLAAQYLMDSSESALEHYIADHIEIIEEGLTLIERQKKVDGGAGVIDILAKDLNNNICVIELKIVDNDKSIVWQSAFYQSEFGPNVRVITIAPNYSPNIVKALSNVRNTELKFYFINEDGHLQIKDYPETKQPATIVDIELLMEEDEAS